MRVIGGELRGRRLRAPRGEATRPTSSRAREALFGWLGAHTSDGDVLDLYAGSGALGIEALSRGARTAVFVERAPAALDALRHNLNELALRDRARVYAIPVQRALALLRREGARFGLVLADPPYRATDLPDLAKRGQLAELLHEGGVLIVERAEGRLSGPSAGGPSASGLWLRESRSYGKTVFDWYERREPSEAASTPPNTGKDPERKQGEVP
jgi:16S rRNA (guanine966-N2)-methyltransferase